MSNATQDSRNPGDSRRRRSRGGSNRNRNRNQGDDRREGGGDRGSRDSRDSRHGNGGQGHSQGRRQDGNRAEEFRPQAPRKTYAPPKLSIWQKILKAVGLYKDPTPPSRYDRQPTAPSSTGPVGPKPGAAADSRPPKNNTRNARSNESGEGRPERQERQDSRPPREPREPRERRAEGEEGAPRRERAPRADRPKGGDPKSVESSRVYVGNLSYDVTEQDLQELFKGVGGVRNVEIVYNRSTHRSKGYGFVEMLRMDEAVRSVEVLHDQPFMGRKLNVSGAKSKGQDEREDSEPEREPKKVVLASTAPAVTAVAEVAEAQAAAAEVVTGPVVDTTEESVPQVAEQAAETVSDLETKYGFDAPKDKVEEA